ncbi:hypothetical protein V4F39_17620 [Aquincola sp. MAHUQ-54]|uniref:Uncharacterized protein n=1 Tax=Aquincola agrisoli TaxID=3119538 RepID=A0AAW9QK29_9BURK
MRLALLSPTPPAPEADPSSFLPAAADAQRWRALQHARLAAQTEYISAMAPVGAALLLQDERLPRPSAQELQRLQEAGERLCAVITEISGIAAGLAPATGRPAVAGRTPAQLKPVPAR